MAGKTYKPSDNIENAIAIESINTTISDSRKDIQTMQKSAEAYHKMLQSSKFGFYLV